MSRLHRTPLPSSWLLFLVLACVWVPAAYGETGGELPAGIIAADFFPRKEVKLLSSYTQTHFGGAHVFTQSVEASWALGWFNVRAFLPLEETLGYSGCTGRLAECDEGERQTKRTVVDAEKLFGLGNGLAVGNLGMRPSATFAVPLYKEMTAAVAVGVDLLQHAIGGAALPGVSFFPTMTQFFPRATVVAPGVAFSLDRAGPVYLVASARRGWIWLRTPDSTMWVEPEPGSSEEVVYSALEGMSQQRYGYQGEAVLGIRMPLRTSIILEAEGLVAPAQCFEVDYGGTSASVCSDTGGVMAFAPGCVSEVRGVTFGLSVPLVMLNKSAREIFGFQVAWSVRVAL